MNTEPKETSTMPTTTTTTHTYPAGGLGLPYARAHEDGTNNVTCPACGAVMPRRGYANHFAARNRAETAIADAPRESGEDLLALVAETFPAAEPFYIGGSHIHGVVVEWVGRTYCVTPSEDHDGWWTIGTYGGDAWMESGEADDYTDVITSADVVATLDRWTDEDYVRPEPFDSDTEDDHPKADIPTLPEVVAQIIAEVRYDLTEGRLGQHLSDLTSFSDLHDHVDANMYAADLLDIVIDAAPWETALAFTAMAQEVVDGWIAGGGLR